jgi:hypothetical protein
MTTKLIKCPSCEQLHERPWESRELPEHPRTDTIPVKGRKRVKTLSLAELLDEAEDG